MKRPETGFFAGLSVALMLCEQHNHIYIVIGSKYFYNLICELNLRSMKNTGQPFLFLYVITGLLIITFLAIFLDSAAAERLSREGNLIENLTVILYLGGIVYLLFIASGDRKFRYYSAFVVLLVVLRELDMHSRLTSIRINNFSYYLEPTTPLVERVAVGAALLACVYVLIRYMMNYGRHLVSGLRSRYGYSLTIAAALLVMLIAKLLDSAPRILRENFTIILSSEVKTPMRVIEEILELGIPLLILLACLQYWTFTRGR